METFLDQAPTQPLHNAVAAAQSKPVGICPTPLAQRPDTPGSRFWTCRQGTQLQNRREGLLLEATCVNRLGHTMKNEQLLNDIREANLTYLMLAQNLIRADRTEALYRLGLSQDAADLIAALSPAQVLKVSSSSQLLCRFRVDDNLVWNLLASHTQGADTPADATSRLHASILMAGRFAEAL